MEPDRARIATIEGGRAVAALLVVLYHIDRYYLASPQYWPDAVAGHLFGFGHAGVEFFFVLSGLIITLMHSSDIGRPNRLLSFVRKRFARIYPLYWVCLAAFAMALHVAPAAAPPDLRAIAGSILLVGPGSHQAILFVAWTLFHEMLFYAGFGLLIWRPRVGAPVLALWLLACIALGATDPGTAYPLRFINILFGFGVVAGLVLRRAALPCPALVAAAGIALFLGTGLDEVYWGQAGRLAGIAGYGLGAALTLVGLVALERRGRVGVPAGVVVLGQASYAIYLTHMLVLPPLAKAAARAGLTQTFPAPLAFAALAAAACVTGVLVHRAVERPLVRWTRELLDQRPVPVVRPVPRVN